MIRVPSLIVLNLTSDCNLRCKYCYASAGCNKNYMSKETAIKIIDSVAQYNSHIEVLFHGGEPLLCMDVIKAVINHCKKMVDNKDIKYYIQTNSLLLTKNNAKYLINNNVEICISMDGSNKISNSLRILPNGDEILPIIKSKIDMLRDMNYSTTVLAVLNKKNYLYVDKFIDYLVKNKIYNFSMNYFIKGGRGHDNSGYALNTSELFETTKKIIGKIIEYNKKGIHVIERNIYHLSRTIILNKKVYMCMNSPCGAGNNLLGFTPNGDIYPCDDLSSVEQFKIGNIYDGNLVDILKNNQIINFFNYCTYDNIEKCATCSIKNKCCAGCASRKFYENNTIYSVDPICDFYRKIVPYIENNENIYNELKEIVINI